MAKDNRPKEKMRLTIEFADNGIILRNPECKDEVTLAVHPDTGHNQKGADYSEEYKAVGQKIYDWLINVAVEDHSYDWISTGAELSITATLCGMANL